MTDRPHPMLTAYAVGQRVWHRASGERGIVVGYVAAVRVDYGEGCVRDEPPIVLSSERVTPPDEDGDFETA